MKVHLPCIEIACCERGNNERATNNGSCGQSCCKIAGWVLFAGGAISSVTLFVQAFTWPTAIATLAEESCKLFIFEVNGKSYEHTIEECTTSPGDTIEIQYNPDDPTESISKDFGDRFMPAIIATVLASVGVVMILQSSFRKGNEILISNYPATDNNLISNNVDVPPSEAPATCGNAYISGNNYSNDIESNPKPSAPPLTGNDSNDTFGATATAIPEAHVVMTAPIQEAQIIPTSEHKTTTIQSSYFDQMKSSC